MSVIAQLDTERVGTFTPHDFLLVFHSKRARKWCSYISCVKFRIVLLQEGVPFVYKLALELVFGECTDSAL